MGRYMGIVDPRFENAGCSSVYVAPSWCFPSHHLVALDEGVGGSTYGGLLPVSYFRRHGLVILTWFHECLQKANEKKFKDDPKWEQYKRWIFDVVARVMSETKHPCIRNPGLSRCSGLGAL